MYFVALLLLLVVHSSRQSWLPVVVAGRTVPSTANLLRYWNLTNMYLQVFWKEPPPHR